MAAGGRNLSEGRTHRSARDDYDSAESAGRCAAAANYREGGRGECWGAFLWGHDFGACECGASQFARGQYLELEDGRAGGGGGRPLEISNEEQGGAFYVVSGEHVWSGTDLRVDRAGGMRHGLVIALRRRCE